MAMAVTKVSECVPLYNLQEVLCWKQSEEIHDVTPLRPRADYCYSGSNFTNPINTKIKLQCNSVPKTLICHDMKGGYLNDRFVGCTSYSDDYVFYNWSVVDVFVYFSHHFITIPPVMWINAGHTNGVNVLGTLITEGGDGKSIWDQVLENTNTADVFASKLTEICDHFKFDGYLINIENEIDASQLKTLKYFLFSLKRYLGGKLVIWYDSVSLITGKLVWQNELNENNKDAFLNVDGVYLNYAWNEQNLKISADRAGTRAIDVYVGVDVFGRGTFGGGGYDCDKAAAVIRSHGLSLALFAPGWTHEVQGSVKQEISENFEEIDHFYNHANFIESELKFWEKLWPFMFVHVVSETPFLTTFCRGYAKNSNGLWFNLSQQQYQPSIPFSDNLDRILYTPKLSFTGEGNIILKTKNKTKFRILVCDIKCGGDMKFVVAGKLQDKTKPCSVLLEIENRIQNVKKSSILEFRIVKSYEPSTNPSYNRFSAEACAKNYWVEKYEYEDGWFFYSYFFAKEGAITEISIETCATMLVGLVAVVEESNYSDFLNEAVRNREKGAPKLSY